MLHQTVSLVSVGATPSQIDTTGTYSPAVPHLVRSFDMQNNQISQQMLLLKFCEGTPIKGSRRFAPAGFKEVCSHSVQGGLLPQCSRGVAPTVFKGVCSHRVQGGLLPQGSRGFAPTVFKEVCSHSVQGGLFMKAKRFCVMSVIMCTW